jgi:hypothetical protein
VGRTDRTYGNHPRYFVVGKGLITNSRGDKLNEWKAQFARTDGPECTTLLEAIKYIKPNAIFGLSGAGDPRVLNVPSMVLNVP